MHLIRIFRSRHPQTSYTSRQVKVYRLIIPPSLCCEQHLYKLWLGKLHELSLCRYCLQCILCVNHTTYLFFSLHFSHSNLKQVLFIFSFSLKIYFCHHFPPKTFSASLYRFTSVVPRLIFICNKITQIIGLVL